MDDYSSSSSFPRPPVHQYTVPLDQVEAIRLAIRHLFAVGDTTLDKPHRGYVRFRGQFLQDSATCYDELRAQFEAHGFTPLVRAEENGRVALIGMPIVFKKSKTEWTIPLLLFLATIFSTLYVGSVSETGSVALSEIWRGWPFSLSLLLILGAHELGHYFAARYHNVPVTLPYFLPLPFPGFTPIGTLGAFIRLKAPVKNKRALLDVGAAGPLAGLIFAVPILIIGLLTSDVGPISTPSLLEGNSLFYAGMKMLVFGQMLPSETQDVLLNQVAWAGWVGLLVTGLNLLPIGQLDGGHIAYVLFGRKRARQFFIPIMLFMIVISVASFILYQTMSWGLLIVLLFFFARTHAEPLDDVTEIDPRRRWIALITLLIFFLIFVPIPLRILV